VAGAPIRLPLVEGKGIRFTYLSTEQGLSQSRVDHMLQDRRGFMWIGTYNGLNRYDGYRFKTYKPDLNNPNSLGGLGLPAHAGVPGSSKTSTGYYGSPPNRTA
jgi:ligand-binding sensor domain-containing protein